MPKTEAIAFEFGVIRGKVEDGQVTLTFPANRDDATLSASGKSRVIATTRGNHPIAGTNLVLGINAYIPVDQD